MRSAPNHAGPKSGDLVEQLPAQSLLHTRGGAVRDHGAVVVEPGAQQDRGGGGNQRQDRGLAAEHAGQEAAEKRKPGDPDRQRR